jgi:signal transduction histidine kinase
VEEQIKLFRESAYLAECNDALARMYGRNRAEDILGAKFDQLALTSSTAQVENLHKFVSSGYRLLNLQTEEVAEDGSKRYYSSNLIGTIVNDLLLRIWGVKRDRTTQRTIELKLEQAHKQQRLLSAHLQCLREKERADLAREIHDTLGQSLTSVKIEVSLLEQNLKKARVHQPPVEERLSEINHLLNETISLVKTLSTELRPGVLDKFGLGAAIEWQCEQFGRRTGIRCESNVPEEGLKVAPALSTALFRIVQEALTNVARHAQASKVKIEIATDDSNVLLKLSDNGRGITREESEAPSSLGLLGMRERAETLGGALIINGTPRKGTVLSVSIPLKD